jgi:hypothetical protein
MKNNDLHSFLISLEVDTCFSLTFEREWKIDIFACCWHELCIASFGYIECNILLEQTELYFFLYLSVHVCVYVQRQRA